MAVLRSNDWNELRPSYVLIESLGTSVEDALGSKEALFYAEPRPTRSLPRPLIHSSFVRRR